MVGFHQISRVEIFFFWSILDCSLLLDDLFGFVDVVVCLLKTFNSEVEKALFLGVETLEDVHSSLEELGFINLLDYLELDSDSLSELSAIWLHHEELSDVLSLLSVSSQASFIGHLNGDVHGELLIAFNWEINWKDDLLESIEGSSLVLTLE